MFKQWDKVLAFVVASGISVLYVASASAAAFVPGGADDPVSKFFRYVFWGGN